MSIQLKMTFDHQHITTQGPSLALSVLLSFVILAFVSNVILDSISLITDGSPPAMELCDTKDAESNETSDSEVKVEVKPESLFSSLLDQSQREMNWSASSYFSQLHSEILTPPPDGCV